MEEGASPLEGRRLADRYHLEEELASGGMGGLWLARDEVLGRQVAIKILHDHLASDEGLLERFHLEAVAAARLSHPAVVRVFDTGIDDGVCYIVMELVEGRTVGELLRDRGALPPATVADIARGVLQALAHAHREGVIHRDVKPGNILVGDGGRVKLADFGIAKAAFADDLTTTGNLLGTSRYVSPEQVTGGEVDARSDLYALGVVMYELLTGRPPFEAETHIATATMRLTSDPPSPRSLRPGIPRGLEALMMKALARDPDDRFQTAEDMRAALDRVIPDAERPTEPTPVPAPVRQRSSRSWITIPIVLVLIAGLAVGAFLLLEGFAPEEPSRGSTSAPQSQRLDIVQAYAFDPEGGDGEHPESLGAAIDGNRETYWTTEGYNQDFGIEKDGVGLVLELEEEASVDALRIATDTPGWEFSVFSGDGPASFDTTGTVAAGPETTDDDLRVEIDPPVQSRYVLIWITGLVSADRYRAHINEVEILGA